MEYRLNRKSDERNITILLFCAMFCVAGAVTGTAVFSKTFSDTDIDAYIASQRLLPVDFTQAFTGMLMPELAFLFLILLLGCFSFGWLALAPLLVYGGLGVGTGVCCLCARFGLFGALYAVPVLVVPFLCVAASRCIAGRETFLMSRSLMRRMAGRDSGNGRLLKLIIKVPLCALLDVFACALAAVMRTILYKIIC